MEVMDVFGNYCRFVQLRIIKGDVWRYANFLEGNSYSLAPLALPVWHYRPALQHQRPQRRRGRPLALGRTLASL
jgi:hypothetical protein